MFSPRITKKQMLTIISGMTEIDFARFQYVQEMAGAYLAVAHFEDALIDSMNMCDKVKVKYALREDASRWETFSGKRVALRRSTLGSLIAILRNHDVLDRDIEYLVWIKGKRDHFVHRWFEGGAWPGDLDIDACGMYTRQLCALQLWLARAERNVLMIFERANLIELTRLDDGFLVMNKGVLDLDEP